jgi:anti-anti-sigma factor
MATRRAEPGGAIRLVLAGELDLAALPYLEAALDSAQSDSGRVLLDLNALTLIDCAGIAAIFAAAQRARRRGAVLILLDPHGQVRRLLLDLVGPPVGVGVLDRDDLPERVGPVAA